MTGDANSLGGHCPRCGGEFRPGYLVCPDDGTPLVPGPLAPQAPEAPAGPAPQRAWRAVASFGHEDEARLLAGRLQAEGIDARIFPEPAISVYGRDTVAILGQPIQVLVPEAETPEALRIIEEIEAG